MTEEVKRTLPKPLFLVRTGTMSREDIARAEALADVCIVECSEPEAARYCDPPITADIDVQARAALSIMRTVLASPNNTVYRSDITKWFVEMVLNPEPKKTPRVPQVKK